MFGNRETVGGIMSRMEIEKRLAGIREKFGARSFPEYYAGWKEYRALKRDLAEKGLSYQLPTTEQLWENNNTAAQRAAQ